MGKRIVLVFSLFFLFTPPIFAQVVINEVLPNPYNNPPGSSSEPDEFIELYNNSDKDVYLDNYKLADKSKSFLIKQATISAKSFLSFSKKETKISLNNSGEETVFLYDADGEEIDSFTYNSSTENESYCSFPDGTGEFVSGCTPSKDDSNSPPPTPIPTSTLTPTNTPLPTNTPTSTNTPTPKPTSTPKPTKTPTPTPQPTESVPVEEVLSASDSASPTHTPTATEAIKKDSSRQGNLSLFAGLGFLASGASLFVFKKYKDRLK